MVGKGGLGVGLVSGGLLAVLACGAVAAATLPDGSAATAAAPPAAPGPPPTAGASPTATPTPTPTPVDTTPAPTAASSPVAPSPAPSPSTASTFVYTVRTGDNLSTLALWFDTQGYAPIYAANRAVIGANPDLIQPGMRITVVGTSPTPRP